MSLPAKLGVSLFISGGGYSHFRQPVGNGNSAEAFDGVPVEYTKNYLFLPLINDELYLSLFPFDPVPVGTASIRVQSFLSFPSVALHTLGGHLLNIALASPVLDNIDKLVFLLDFLWGERGSALHRSGRTPGEG